MICTGPLLYESNFVHKVDVLGSICVIMIPRMTIQRMHCLDLSPYWIKSFQCREKNRLFTMLFHTRNPTYLFYFIFVPTWLHEKRFKKILTALQYKPLYNINRSEKWDKKIQTAGYNGVRTVDNLSLRYVPRQGGL